MDLHVMWFRARIVRRVTTRLATVGGAVAALAGAALWLGGGTGLATAAVTGLLIGAGLAGCWLVFSLFTNPIEHRYLRAYLAEALEVHRPEQSPLPHDDGRGAPSLRFTLVDRTADAPVCSVYASGRVIVSRSTNAGKVVMYSRLADGRMIVTDTQLTVPRTDVIMNLCRDADLSTQADHHQALLNRLSSEGMLIDPSPDPHLVIDYLAGEREAFRQLGSIWGCFVSVDGPSSVMELTVDVARSELLALHGLRPTGADEHRRVLAVEPAGISATRRVQGDASLTRLTSPP